MATGRRLLIICLLAFLAREASCQTLESLREDIKRAEREISKTNDLLSKTRKNQQSADKELKLIRNKIRNRRNIISNLEQQAGLLNRNIDEKGSTIASLEQDLARLRKEYGEMVYSAYKNYKLNSFLVFLFSSKDFNDATRRIAYMRRYNRMREQKAARIDSTAASLGREVTDLQNKKSELDKVYQSRNRELASLGKDETQYKASSEKFRNEASRLASTIKQNKKKIEQLQQRIQRLIEAESRKHKAQPRSAAQNEYIAKLSGQFDQNRGKLPYPVRGVIVDGYGKHAHAVRQSVTVNNTGINIAAEAGAPVKAVFEGEVSVVFFVPGMNNAVMIRHGDYVTVYANLEAVGVKTGDRVTLNQTIGKLPADDAFLHFEIWKDQQNLNPELWLRK